MLTAFWPNEINSPGRFNRILAAGSLWKTLKANVKNGPLPNTPLDQAWTVFTNTNQICE